MSSVLMTLGMVMIVMVVSLVSMGIDSDCGGCSSGGGGGSDEG